MNDGGRGVKSSDDVGGKCEWLRVNEEWALFPISNSILQKCKNFFFSLMWAQI